MSSYNIINHEAWTTEQKAAIIMAALEREELSQEYVELIQGWISRGGDAGEADVFMDALFDRMFIQHPGPTSLTQESFARLREKLGLPNDDPTNI